MLTRRLGLLAAFLTLGTLPAVAQRHPPAGEFRHRRAQRGAVSRPARRSVAPSAAQNHWTTSRHGRSCSSVVAYPRGLLPYRSRRDTIARHLRGWKKFAHDLSQRLTVGRR